MEAINEANFFVPLYNLLFDHTKTPIERVPNFLDLVKNRTSNEKEEVLSCLLKNDALDVALQLVMANADVKIPSEFFQKPLFFGVL